MRTHTVLGIAALVGAIVVVTNAGPLDPPAGPVAPTGKTLTEVEPRTALDAPAGQIISISEPGSYYLTGDRDGLTSNGINILTGGVTLDLNGFALRGTGVDNLFFGENGIFVSDVANGTHPGPIVIRNGSVTNFGDAGIESRATDVIVVIEDVVVEAGNDAGILLLGDGRVTRCTVTADGTSAANEPGISVQGTGIIEDCTVENVPTDGYFLLEGEIRGSTAINAGGNGFVLGLAGTQHRDRSVRVTRCASRAAGATGFVSEIPAHFEACHAHGSLTLGFDTRAQSVLTRCKALRNGGGGFLAQAGASYTECLAEESGIGTGFSSDGFEATVASTFDRCVARGNTDNGFVASSGSTFTGCIADANGDAGITAGRGASIASCTAVNNGSVGISASQASSISGSTAEENAGNGIRASSGSTVSDCTARSNGLDGFDVSGTLISGCLATFNDGDGISAFFESVIDGNTVFSNTGTGIEAGRLTTVVRNTARDNGSNYFFAAGANAGPVVTNAATATSPWANFSN